MTQQKVRLECRFLTVCLTGIFILENKNDHQEKRARERYNLIRRKLNKKHTICSCSNLIVCLSCSRSLRSSRSSLNRKFFVHKKLSKDLFALLSLDRHTKNSHRWKYAEDSHRQVMIDVARSSSNHEMNQS